MIERDFSFYRDLLTKDARQLVWKHCNGGPPYDPFKVARALNVVVRLEYLEGAEGYTECEDGQFVAVIASQSIGTRQRFTLAHELGHVLLMRKAQRAPLSLNRYRGAKIPDSAHQDPTEESLCNAFAAELLLPSEEIQQRFPYNKFEPRSVFHLASDYDVSVHASAKRIVTIFGKNRIGLSYWSCVGPNWITPVWWTGLQMINSSKSLKKLEALVSEAMRSRTEIVECWQSPSRNASSTRTEVQVVPTAKGKRAIVCLRERRGAKLTDSSLATASGHWAAKRTPPMQMSLFVDDTTVPALDNPMPRHTVDATVNSRSNLRETSTQT